MELKIICLEDRAFFALLEKVITHIREKYEVKEDRWVSAKECMSMLRITSKSTLQKFRDEGRIRFTQPEKKIILYDRNSIEAYLNKHTKETF